MTRERESNPFATDVAEIGGYVYTTNARLSSQFANRRLTEAAETAANFAQRHVLDIGCGDGEYTVVISREYGARSVCGVDVNVAALAVALKKSGRDPIRFVAASADSLPFRAVAFEVGQLRGVLHHLNRPAAVLSEAFRVCSTIAIIEPNGYNPVLKVLECCSPYHRQHAERSYAPRRLDRWIAAAGATVTHRFWAGLVPMFCPDWMARLLKRVEPIIERFPLLNLVACAVYVVAAERSAHE